MRFVPSSTQIGTCKIHRAKPVQCRTYPFWPEFLASPFEWKAEGARCRGDRIGPRAGPRQEVWRQLVLETLSRSAREEATRTGEDKKSKRCDTAFCGADPSIRLTADARCCALLLSPRRVPG